MVVCAPSLVDSDLCIPVVVHRPYTGKVSVASGMLSLLPSACHPHRRLYLKHIFPSLAEEGPVSHLPFWHQFLPFRLRVLFVTFVQVSVRLSVKMLCFLLVKLGAQDHMRPV